MAESKISNSAFLVNYLRHKSKDQSGDHYAGLWLDDSMIPDFQLFEKEVNNRGSYELALRHRYFLSLIEQFITNHEDCKIVNLGAGFTSYPYLISRPVPFCEVDYPSVIAFKKEKTRNFTNKGRLPERNIYYLKADLNNIDDIGRLAVDLGEWVSGSTVLFVMEGLLYYLNRSAIDEIFSMIRQVQKPGGSVGFDYWMPGAAKHPIFEKWSKYAKKVYGYTELIFTYLEKEYFLKTNHFKISDDADYPALEKRFNKTRFFTDPMKHFPENFLVLTHE